MNKKKWLLIGAYKPPTVPENIFTSDFIKCLDQVTCNYDNFMVLGDLNFDYLHAEKGNALKNVCDILDLTKLTFLIYSFSKFAVHVRHRRFYHCPFL
jgi:hypothetical protein